MSEQRLFACERCSRRKQRCDRTIPVCQPCQEAQAECMGSASEGTVISGNDRVIARKGPVTRLLEQIEALEEKLRGRDRGEPGHGNASAAVAHDRMSPDAAAGPSEHQDNATLPQSTSMNMRFLSLSAMAEPSSRRGEFLKHLSTPWLIAGITKTYGGDPESTARPDSLWEGISTYLHHPQGSKHRLRIPPADANKALEVYLAVVDLRFPRLPVDKFPIVTPLRRLRASPRAGIVYSWAAGVLNQTPEKKAVATSMIDVIAQLGNIMSPYFFRDQDEPRYLMAWDLTRANKKILVEAEADGTEPRLFSH
ncbi:STB5 [Fusarium acutatum]|uniref:STB5 n=1 Tax=Fusarium acutatum TaxID=78861 RepID=A0A8H4JW38_9HYPO|nr:STB5 [Fusarium acutatum]